MHTPTKDDFQSTGKLRDSGEERTLRKGRNAIRDYLHWTRRERTSKNSKRDGVASWSHVREGSVFLEKHRARFGAEKKDSGECDRRS